MPIKILRSEKGSVMVATAIALPVFVTGVLYTLDSCRLLNRRMNLLHAGDEATLAIATTGNMNTTAAEKEINDTFVRNYLSVYLPDAKSFPLIRVTTETVNNTIEPTVPGSTASTVATTLRYNVYAKAEFDTVLPMPESARLINLTYGGAADTALPMGTDYIFAVDMSYSVHEPNWRDDNTKGLGAAKSFIPTLVTQLLNLHPDNRVAIMPHSESVPQILRDSDGNIIPNERGGPSVGCGYLFVPTEQYKLTYPFWTHQPFYRTTANTKTAGSYAKEDDNYKQFVKDESAGDANKWNHLTYEIDKARYNYYETFVLRSLDPVSKKSVTLGTMEQLAEEQIPELKGIVKCDKNDSYVEGADAENKNTGRYKYSCYTLNDPWSNIFAEKNMKILKDEYAKVVPARFKQDEYASILHGESIDYEQTLNQLFKLEPMIMKFNWGNYGSDVTIDTPPRDTNYYDHGRRHPTYRPFNETCHSAGWWGNQDRYTTGGNSVALDNHGSKIKSSSLEAGRVTPRNYLINLTNDINELDAFKTFQPFGHKHSGHALLYSTYLARKGNNPRKAILIFGMNFDETYHIAGIDDGSTRDVTIKLLNKNNDLCARIKSGFAAYDSSVRRVDIYYIKMYDQGSDNDTAGTLWANSCVGANNVFQLQDGTERTKLTQAIIRASKESGSFK